MIEANDGSISNIDIEYLLSGNTDIEKKLQANEADDNSEIENNNLNGCNLDNDQLSEIE